MALDNWSQWNMKGIIQGEFVTYEPESAGEVTRSYNASI